MTDAETAYAEAEKLIAKAVEGGEKELDFISEKFRALETIPPEIAELKNLSVLKLRDTKISDLSPLVSLTNLSELYLQNTQVKDIAPLAALSELFMLELRGLRIDDFKPLHSLINLHYLDLAHTNMVDLSPLRFLTALTQLYLRGSHVDSLTPLENLSYLAAIGLSHTSVSDLRPLRKSMLITRGNNVGNREISLEGTPVLTNDPKLAKIYSTSAVEQRFDAIATYLESLPEPIPDREDVDALRREFSNIQTKIGAESDVLAKIRSETDLLNAGLEAARGRLKSFEDETEKRIEAAKGEYAKSMEAAEEAFNEGAATAAPVELWKVKEKEHVENRDSALKRFYKGLIAIAALAGLAITLVISGWIDGAFVSADCAPATPESCANVGAKGFLIGGALLTLFTALLWFTRLQLKLYLAERHMQMDARERRAFAQTYVGFLKEGDISKEAQEQRGLVYGALFRPSSDGTVKDEGGVDPSIAAALSKFLAKS